MREGERQVAPTLDGIRRDHVARYEWAARVIGEPQSVVDFACGIGYGTAVLADAGHMVLGFDIDAEAIAYGNAHYRRPTATLAVADADASDVALADVKADYAVSFETIEHLENPRPFLKGLRKHCRKLLASVPNEDEFPYIGYAFHFRHYTKQQFEDLLNECGWHVRAWHGQEGPESEVEPGAKGRTIIAACVRGEAAEPKKQQKPEEQRMPHGVPKHVAIVGLGPSSAQYVSICRALGGRRKFADETWGINAFGDVLACDKIFHMDDVRIQEIRAKANPESNIAGMIEWMRTTTIPVITCRTHPGYPTLVEFPLEAVLNAFPNAYFNSSAAYAVAYAIALGVERISLFGFDFTYENAHDAEKGRACVEFWLGIASERGIQITVPKTTSLLDACNSQDERFYGFSDTRALSIKRVDEKIVIELTERDSLPSAAEIEERYDHTAHPNPLMKEQE